MATARRRTGCRSGVPWRGQDLGRFSIAGSASGSSFSRSLKPATKRRRRQRRAAPGRRSPASGPGRRRDGAPAADRACRGVVLGRFSIAGSASGSSFSRSLKPATKRRRRQCRAAPGRRSPASGPGRRRDGAPAADRACRGLVVVSGGWQAAVAGVCSCWRCCGQWRAAHRAAPGRRSPASEPGRRPDGTPAADRACRGLVKVSVCWQASVAGVCQGSRRRGSCWWCCGQGVQLVGQFGRVFVLSIGETGHEATTAPASSST
jgi:hypothetical protein